MLTLVSRTISLLLIGALTLVSVSYYKKGVLPAASELRPEVLQAPRQTKTSVAPFQLTYRGQSYSVQPVAQYEISGVLVSHNSPAGFGDIYHDENSVDLRDVCLVWGENVKSGAYLRGQYWSESFTCNWKFRDAVSYGHFQSNEISNNHLLASDARVQQEIRSLHIGDQVELKGLLVNYAPLNNPERVRSSSLVREDQGNGACEVMFVERVRRLRAATPAWYVRYDRGWRAVVALGLLQLVAWVLFPYLEFKLQIGGPSLRL